MDPQPFRSKTKANSAHLLYLRGPASSNSLTHLAALSYGGTITQEAIRPGFMDKGFLFHPSAHVQGIYKQRLLSSAPEEGPGSPKYNALLWATSDTRRSLKNILQRKDKATYLRK